MNNNPKDAYYVFKSYWTENPRFCYIESHTWTERNGKKNEKKELNVFSNCPQVELFVNGASQGKLARDTKKFPACGLSWQVIFKEGDNNIVAVGYNENNECAKDTLKINYSTKPFGRPDNISLNSERLPNGKYLITAFAVDVEGNRCTNFNKRVYFSAISGGRLIDNLGTPSGSSVVEMANGKAQIIFEHIPLEKGVVEVRNQDFKGSYVVIE
jgi:beta-galactosidase